MRRSGWVEDRRGRTGRRWRARYRGPDGRVRSRSFDRKVDADRWIHTQLVRIDRGDWTDPAAGDVTLAEWSERWLRSLALKETTRAEYESLLRSRILPEFGSVPINRITPAAIREWSASMTAAGLSASRVRAAKGRLAQCLQVAVVDGLLLRNPADGVSTPPVRRRAQRFLYVDDVAALAAAAEARQHTGGLVVEVLAYVGLRWGELVALRRSRVDVLRRRIDVAESATEIGARLSWSTPKSHEPRTVTMPSTVVNKLARHLGAVPPDGLVFTAPRGGPLRSSTWRRNVWMPAANEAGIAALRVHDLRHTAASLMISSGASIKAVQRQLGHATATMTLDLYGHLYDDDLDALADALDRRLAESPAPPARPQRAPAGPGEVVPLQAGRPGTLT
jgi:integrase